MNQKIDLNCRKRKLLWIFLLVEFQNSKQHFFSVFFIVRNDVLTGRVPLILPCKHTVCEGCIRSAVRQKLITCPKCATIHSLDKPEMRLQEMFPVNFYVVGLIHYSKPAVGDHLYDFKPAGYRWLMNPPRALPREELIEIGGFETENHGKWGGKWVLSALFYIYVWNCLIFWQLLTSTNRCAICDTTNVALSLIIYLDRNYSLV